MKFEDIDKILKGANKLHKMKLYLRYCKGGKRAVLWVYCNYERKSLGFPGFGLTSNSATQQEVALLKKAIVERDRLEAEGGAGKASRRHKVLEILQEWIEHYATESGKKNAKLARDKFLEAAGDIPIGTMSRQHILKMMDGMKRNGYHSNYVRGIASRIRAFCNWAEQRGYMGRVDTRKLLPPEQFGEIKALGEEEIKTLAETPCDGCPDVKDLFMLGVYTAQRIGEIKGYTFSMLRDKEIKATQGKTGKFIVIPLSKAALAVMERLRLRRQSEGMGTDPGDKMFSLPSDAHQRRVFKSWVKAAGLPGDRVTPHNSRSTAISLLIKKGVSESVTQELANHASPAITARYYRQIDVEQKKEALDKIPEF